MEATNFKRGDKVIINTREGKLLKGFFQHVCPNGKLYIKAENGVCYERSLSSVKKVGEADTSFAVSGMPDAKDLSKISISTPTKTEWGINKKFEFLSQLIRMVINKTSVSLVVTGEGGLGKSFTVKKQLEIKKLVKNDDFIIIKGFSTPRGLFRTLFENNGKLIIFDDCDEVLEDKIAKNLLKGALDSYDSREIHWITKTSDESLPDSFEFTGRVIFISNMSQDKIDQAILSRAMSIDLTMSKQDMIERMQFIINNSKEFMPQYPKEWHQESLDLIKDNLNEVRELSLRSLEKVVKIRAGEKDEDMYDEEVCVEDGKTSDWHDLARFMLLS